MRNLILLLSLVTATLLSSCSSETFEERQVSTSFSQDPKVSSFYNQLDSVNSLYNIKTRGNNKGKVVKYGTRVLSAMVDGSVGVVSGAATGGLGGFIFGTAASWAFEDYFSGVLREAERQDYKRRHAKAPQDTTFVRENPPTTFAFSSKNGPSLSDSVGYIHNNVLADVAATQKSYVSKNLTIDYESLVSDCAAESKKYGLDADTLIQDKNRKAQLIKLTKDAVDAFIGYTNDSLSFEECFSKIENSLKEIYGGSSEYIKVLKDIENKIHPIISEIPNDELFQYAYDVNDIINKSELTETQKKAIKQICDLTVNSQLYWNENSCFYGAGESVAPLQ